MSQSKVTLSDVNVEGGTLNFVMSGSQEYGLDKSTTTTFKNSKNQKSRVTSIRNFLYDIAGRRSH